MNTETDYSNFIEYKVTETRWVPLSRKLTDEEKNIIENYTMYDLPDGLVLWEQEEVQDCDHGMIRIFEDDNFTEYM